MTLKEFRDRHHKKLWKANIAFHKDKEERLPYVKKTTWRVLEQWYEMDEAEVKKRIRMHRERIDQNKKDKVQLNAEMVMLDAFVDLLQRF